MHFHTAGWADLLAQFLQAEAFRAGELEEELVKSIGRQGAEVVMNMLNPYPDERLTATQALQTPYLSKGSAQVMQPSQTELTPTAHAVHGQVGQQPPEGLEHIEAQAHAAAADQQQLSLPVVHDRLNGAALSEHAQTELYNGKGDASQGTAVIKACTKTDQPSWNERSKDSGQGLQNGGHKVSLAAHAGQLGVPLLHKPQDGVASIDAAQEQPALDSAAERVSQFIIMPSNRVIPFPEHMCNCFLMLCHYTRFNCMHAACVASFCAWLVQP